MKDMSNITNKLSEIYSKSRDNYEYTNFMLGFIVNDGPQYLTAYTVDDYGFLDTCTLILKADVSKIDQDTNYTKMFEFFIDSNRKAGNYDPFSIQERTNNLLHNDLLTSLKECQKADMVISICSNQDSFVHQGRIASLTNSTIQLNELEYSEYAGTDDVSQNDVVPLTDITAVDLFTKENILFKKYIENIKSTD